FELKCVWAGIQPLKDRATIAPVRAVARTQGASINGSWSDGTSAAFCQCRVPCPRLGVGMRWCGRRAHAPPWSWHPSPQARHELPHKDALRQDASDDAAGNVGQSEVAPLEAVSQPLVVDSEEVQNRRVEVVDVDRVLHDVVAEVVGLAPGDARLDA